jgi:hypothetical protein
VSEKAYCPGCDAYTSSILRAQREGEDCPYCELPDETRRTLLKARDKAAVVQGQEAADLLLVAAAKGENMARQVLDWAADIQRHLERADNHLSTVKRRIEEKKPWER